MHKVYKYPITQDNIIHENITLPRNAIILSVICQNNLPVLYCLVDPEEEWTEDHTIIVAGTGWEIDKETVNKITRNNLKFLGTIQQYEGQLIWHIWIE